MTFAANSSERLRALALCAILLAPAMHAQKPARKPASAAQQPANGDSWTHYGGDAGGTRYSSAVQITPANVRQLQPVWEFHTHALDHPRFADIDASFESTPILSRGLLYLTSPFDVVFALDARSGQQRWTFDPQTKPLAAGGIITSRGVALWESDHPAGACSRRILFGTVDARLMELDADTGQPCADFGRQGAVDLTQDVHFQHDGYYEVTSVPAVAGNIVIVGSAVGDNVRVDPESGLVRAFDVVSGRELWSWEPLPWASQTHPRTGAGNVWSTISVDPELGLAFLPTSSASPDYWGGTRPGDNRDADSIVALDVHTGRKVWAFQVVHHDLWDYDIAAQPLLFTFHDGTPAVAVATKMGEVFVFDRRNGKPLFPIEERPVPQTDVRGEVTSPTQPFSSLPTMTPTTLLLESSPGQWQRSPADRQFCQTLLTRYRYDGIFTPPSLRGSILFPGNLGGVNWGSMAFDPATGILYANNNRTAYVGRLVKQGSWYLIWHIGLEPKVRDWPLWIEAALTFLLTNVIFRLIARKKLRLRYTPWLPGPWGVGIAMGIAAIAIPMCLFPRPVYRSHFGREISPQDKAPYRILREPLVDKSGHPCVTPPWGAITALDLNRGTLTWQSTLGSLIAGQTTGTDNFGGPIVTASGLLFTAAAEDRFLRAFDSRTGALLWAGRLPVPAQSTPMTFVLDGRQYVVVSAGGHADNIAFRGDSVIAFALPAAPRN